ncbi:hypothetical protein CYMTET_44716 [Cymbomonas tetramitiformis]|uniref:CRAL-TRIO domain-containing protein n=1 Tax=Cymbomonas tetramitiformis TaxID=36881 RepID=A0AAE0C0X1_9CHLO|nr:hypothetical protein CYMTET_44716 [Cymbomonas tetramitiformis]
MDSSTQVEQLRLRLNEESNKQVDDKFLQRYLRAEKGSVDSAAKRVIQTLAWREEHVNKGHLTCHACQSSHHSHYMHTVGVSKAGMPVIYSCFALAANFNTKDNVRHMVHTFEHAISLMNNGVEKWIWIADFSGFGISHCNPSIALAANTLFSTYYPERLGTFVLLGTPRIFGTLFSAIKPHLDPVTATKLDFIQKKPQEMSEKLGQYLDGSLLHWLLEEVEENAAKGIQKRKQSRKEAWTERDFHKHNPIGTPAFAELISQQARGWQHTFFHRTPEPQEAEQCHIVPKYMSEDGTGERLAPSGAVLSSAAEAEPTVAKEVPAAQPLNIQLPSKQQTTTVLTDDEDETFFDCED